MRLDFPEKGQAARRQLRPAGPPPPGPPGDEGISRPAGPPEFDPSTLAPEQLTRVQDFEKRITDFAAGLEAQGIPKDQQEFQAFQQFGPEMGRLANELGGNVPGWFREFAGKAQTAYQDQSWTPYDDYYNVQPLSGYDPFSRPGGPGGQGPGGGFPYPASDRYPVYPTPGSYPSGLKGDRPPFFGDDDGFSWDLPGTAYDVLYDLIEGRRRGGGPPDGGMPDWMNTVLGLIPGYDPTDPSPQPGSPPGVWPFPYPTPRPGGGGGGGPTPPRPGGGGQGFLPTPGGDFDWGNFAGQAARMAVPGLLGWLLGRGGGGGGGQVGELGLEQLAEGPLGNLSTLMSSSAVPSNIDEYYKALTGLPSASPFSNMITDVMSRSLGGGPFAHLATPNLISQFLPGGGTITDAYGQQTQIPGATTPAAGVLPFLQSQLQYLQGQGLPGQRQLSDPSGFEQFLGGTSRLLESLPRDGVTTGIVPGMEYLFREGFPGQAAIGGGIDPAMAASQSLLATGGGGGLIPGMQHLLNQGLPGQQLMAGLIPNQLGVGGAQQRIGLGGLNAPFVSGPQAAAEQAITGGIMGGGISPQFVQAARERILAPAQEALMGRLNAMGGGVASLQGGLPQELLRRQEQDFLNDLIIQGQRDFTGQQALGLQAGGQGFQQQMQRALAQVGAGERAIGTGMGAFGAIPEAALPIMQLAGGLQGQLANQALQQYMGLGGQGLQAMQTASGIQQALANQALQRFDVLGGRGLETLRTFGDIGQIPFQQAAMQTQLMNQAIPQAMGRESLLGDVFNRNVGNAINYMNVLLGNQTQQQAQNDYINAMNRQAQFNTLGTIVPPILQTVWPDVFGRPTAGGTPPYGGGTPPFNPNSQYLPYGTSWG